MPMIPITLKTRVGRIVEFEARLGNFREPVYKRQILIIIVFAKY